ncbi:hypothetical protein KGY63_05995 [Candidatus Bipolaricaulota bacterium]|nr:hypothetical protein [Candidatus Bipolaricaulota bacterium]
MRTFGNIIWHFPFLGFLEAISAYLLGCLFIITIIGAPIGRGLIELAKFYLLPFERKMVRSSDVNTTSPSTAWRGLSFIAMILYLPFGIIFAIFTIIQIAGLFISIIGIPAGMALGKSLGTVLNPVGKECVSRAVGEEIERRKASEEVQRTIGTDSS